MSKCAFLFPGQGSQEIGMGRDIIDHDPFTISLLQVASDLVHEDIARLCLKGPAQKMKEARFLQPALVAICLGYWKRLIEYGICPDVIAGHSLGEITSLGAAGVVPPEVCLQIAIKRGELMDDVAVRVKGGMLAVLFVSLENVERLIAEIDKNEGRLVIANDNAPEQVVISGECDLLDLFAARIHSEKLGKCRKLDVIGPWHSPYMNESRKIFEQWVAPVRFNSPSFPIVFNATASFEHDPVKIKELITWQLTRPVFWRKCMVAIKSIGVSTLFEIGPQRILSTLARLNGFGKSSTIYNVNNLNSIKLMSTSSIETRNTTL